jgi:VanZ family protein
MITNLLLDNSALVPVALLLIAAVCVGVGHLLLRAGRHGVLWVLVMLSMLPVIALTLVPTAIEALQALVPAIGRACDTNDWAMNTMGTLLAVLLAAATVALTTSTT